MENPRVILEPKGVLIIHVNNLFGWNFIIYVCFTWSNLIYDDYNMFLVLIVIWFGQLCVYLIDIKSVE